MTLYELLRAYTECLITPATVHSGSMQSKLGAEPPSGAPWPQIRPKRITSPQIYQAREDPTLEY